MNRSRTDESAGVNATAERAMARSYETRKPSSPLPCIYPVARPEIYPAGLLHLPRPSLIIRASS